MRTKYLVQFDDSYGDDPDAWDTDLTTENILTAQRHWDVLRVEGHRARVVVTTGDVSNVILTTDSLET